MQQKLSGKRCPWCGIDPVYVDYHDTEWGVPEYDSRALFEKLILDGFQAGLSWITILKKRDAFRTAFANFHPEIIANFSQQDVEKLMQNKSIVRNRLKITGAIKSAQGYLKIQEKTPFSDFLWAFVDHKIVDTKAETIEEVPTKTKQSEAMSKTLKQYGFTFVGPTITYAFMQATGMVNDHLIGCPRHDAVKQLR